MFMKQEIQKFKEQNGNVKYTVKELLYGLNQKVDEMRDDIRTVTIETTTNTTSIKYLKACIGGIITTIVFILGYIFL